jgi:hypothetical protein
VGSFYNGTENHTLVIVWNGSTWSIVSSPNVGDVGSILAGVSCTSPVSCDAVGVEYAESSDQTIVESFNGSKWSVVSSPNQGSLNNLFDSVSCSTSSSCQAAGY